jgi:hypothetical protein
MLLAMLQNHIPSRQELQKMAGRVFQHPQLQLVLSKAAQASLLD